MQVTNRANPFSLFLWFAMGIVISLGVVGCYGHGSAEDLITPNTQQTDSNNQSQVEAVDTSEITEVIDISKPLPGWDVLEVYTARTTDDGVQLRLINHDKKVFVKAIIPTEVVAYSDTNSEQAFELGDRVQIVGDYKRGSDYSNVTVVNVKKVHKLGPHSAKVACESVEGREWRLVGMAQTSACVTNYTDAGKPCQSSDECQGHCMVGYDIERATCAASDSYFGCGAFIENFRVTGSIVCID